VSTWTTWLMPALLIAAITVRAARWYRRAQARETLVAFAVSNGWDYRGHDPELVSRWFLPPFGRGERREARHVIHGLRGGRSFVAFEYTYVDVSRDSRGRRRERRHHAAIVALAMPGWLPTVTVVPETVVDRALRPLRRDIELESEDFNRAFTVTGDARSASDLLTPRTMERLARGPRFAWRSEGDHLVSWQSEPLTPSTLLHRLNVLDGVLTAAPTFLWASAGRGLTRSPGDDPAAAPPVPGSGS
jgi:hypothetical protein